MAEAQTTAAVFLDRDGTLNPDPGYIASPDDYELYPETIPALKTLATTGLPLILVTNQSGVGRGLIEESSLEAIHEKLSAALAEHGLSFLDTYHCPHTPADECTCRKPATDMFTRAAKEHGIDLVSSYVIGDSPADVAAANTMGAHALLVRTGNGHATESEIMNGRLSADFVGDDLRECARYIVEQEGAW